MDALQIVIAITAVPILFATAYLFLLTLLSRQLTAPREVCPRLRFAVVVPAHDEEQGIAGTVANLLALDYPRELFGVLVVADNCTDRTAQRAEAAGANVLVRRDALRRGKGYALAGAFQRILEQDRADAVVVIDADTLASPNLLRAFSARLDTGASAIQADYRVRNPESSWRTRLMAIALGMFHALRSRARERLGVSAGLRGNGMCFRSSLLREVHYDAFSVVEDLEYGIRLGERGQRIHYAAEAHVYGEMPRSSQASRSQRLRWERGRRKMARLHAPRLLGMSFARRDPVLFDLALDLLVPPLSTLTAVSAAGLLASIALAVSSGTWGPSIILWAAAAVFIAGYVLRGWALSGTGARGLLALTCAPAFVIWKMALLLKRSERRDEWVRTAREGEVLWKVPGPGSSPRA